MQRQEEDQSQIQIPPVDQDPQDIQPPIQNEGDLQIPSRRSRSSRYSGPIQNVRDLQIPPVHLDYEDKNHPLIQNEGIYKSHPSIKII